MKYLPLTLALHLIVSVAACAPAVHVSPEFGLAPAGARYKTQAKRGRCILIKADDDDALQAAQACGGRWLRKLSYTGLHLIDLQGGDVESSLALCRASRGVQYAEGDDEVITAGLDARAVPAAAAAGHDRLSGGIATASEGHGVRVAVLDTGADTHHPALEGRVVLSANFTPDVAMDDRHGHGTALAGVVAGGGTGAGRGVAPRAELMIGKVLGDDGTGITSAVTDGIIWATNQGAKVILLGLVARRPSQALEDAVAFARLHDVVVVAAAGNGGSAAKVQPGAYPDCLSVAATAPDGALAKFTSWGGHWVDVAAPGVGVPAPLPNHPNALGIVGQGALDGSSVAAAFVAGEAALLRAALPGATSTDIRARIEAACVKDNPSPWWKVRHGRVNLRQALALPASPP